jgi:pro-kumamolisin-like protein/PKD domain-containing protein
MPIGHPRTFLRLGRLALVVAIAALVAVPLLGRTSGPGPGASSPPGGAAAPGGVVIAPAFVPGPSTVDLGPVAASTSIDVAVGVAAASTASAALALNLIDTPGTPEYRHYLTPAEVATRFGPSPTSYAAASAHFLSYGLTVRPSPDRTMLLVSGPASRIGASFGTSFETYREAGRTFFSHPTPARLPAGVPWSGALGLGNVTPVHPATTGPGSAITPFAGCSSTGGLIPCQIEKAYNLSALLAGGANGSGYTLAVVDTYDGNEPQSQLAADLSSFDSAVGLAAGTVNYLYPVPTSRNLNSTGTGWALEEALDLEWARAMAPAATIKMTFAPDPTAGLYGAVDWLVAHHAADVISLSWGEPDVGTYNAYAGACPSACNATTDGSYALLHPVLQAAALEGITVFSATGDCGAAAGTSGVSTDYPSSDPFVTGVGGTDLTINGTNAYVRETGWSGNATGATSPGCQNQGGSGGGFSPFPRPYWQVATGFPAARTVRGVPDVSIDGGTGVAIVYQGFATAATGTSVSSPLWAGIVTDLDTYGAAPLGFVNPSLYAIAAGASGLRAFHDVRSGSNGYAAGTGWDPVTGLGTPNVGVLAPMLTRTTPTASGINSSLLAGPRFGATPLTVAFQVRATGGGTPYAFEQVDFGDFNTSLAPNGFVNHTYARAGVYDAWAVVYDSQGNSSISTPVVIVVGGGGSLNVTLTSSRPAPLVGQAVTFQANVTGGTSPYTFNWTFGDGTYLTNRSAGSAVHAYGAAGPACAAVTVHDSGNPQSGGGSNGVLELVGGASAGFCTNASALVTNFTPTPNARDLPGDFRFAPVIAGGSPPYTVQYASDDPYARLCGCGIFRLAGVHQVTAFVNDSVNQQTTVAANVTLYPALFGTFTTTVVSGPAPLPVGFGMTVGGGHGANTSRWLFGDGQSAPLRNTNHTYNAPGFYVAVGRANDSFGGNVSEAFLIDVTDPTAPPPVIVTAILGPAVAVPVGTPQSFRATVTNGTAGPYSLAWTFAPSGFSAFGSPVTETFPYSACLLNGTCTLYANLTVRNATGGTVAVVPIRLDGSEQGNASALTFTSRLSPTTGGAPFTVFGTAGASGVPGANVRWDFGDGGSALGSPVTHLYVANGEYTTTISATDSGGDVLVHTVAVTGSPPGPGVVVVTGAPNVTAGVAPLRVGFSVSAAGGTGPPYTYNWMFGDGTNGAGAIANHTYPRPGHYVAYATASDGHGSNGTTAYSLDVYNGTAVDVTLRLLPNVTTPGGTVDLVVRATTHCTPTSVPTCSVRNLTVRATVAAVGSTAPPTGFGSGAWTPIALDGSGSGGAVVSAPGHAGTYVVTAETAGRNYTGLAVAYLVVTSTTPPPPPDHSAVLLVASGVVGLAAGIAAFVVLRPRRRDPSSADTAPNL